MKSFVHLVVLFAAAILLVGCATGAIDPPPVKHTPTGFNDSSAATGAAPKTPALSTATPAVAALPIPVIASPASADGLPLRDQSDIDRQAVRELRAIQKTHLSAGTSFNPQNPDAPVAKPKRPLEGAELYVHVPPQANSPQSLRVLLVLHGMGNRGEPFSQNLIRDAERNHWVIVAPTFQYRNYLDPIQLMEDDILFAQRILDTLDVLPRRLNLKLRQHILIYGFSRGAQLAHRFAYFYPDRVESVVTLSAGAYTLPTEKRPTDKGTQVLPFPYGIGNLQECVGQPVNWQALKKISFWIGVGAQDDQSSDVARAFDPYGGKTRVERAQTFQHALKTIGIEAQLIIFPDAAHEVTGQMRASALQFLRDDELTDHWDD